MFEHLGNQKRVQGWLVIPYLAVEPMPVQTQCSLGHLESLVGPNLHRAFYRNQELNSQQGENQNSRENDRFEVPIH